MKSASVSFRSTVARRPQSCQLRLEHLENRTVPGSVLGLSSLDSQLNVMAQAALGPLSELALATATAQATAVSPDVSTPLSSPAAAALLYPQAIPDVLSQGVPATQSGSAQAPSGPALEILATQTLFGGLEGPQFGPKLAPPPGVQNGNFSAGFSHWTIAFPDVFVSTGSIFFPTAAILGTVGEVDVISQVIFWPHSSATVSFDYDNIGGGTETQLEVLFDGLPVFTSVNTAPTGPVHVVSAAIPLPAGLLQDTVSIVERNDPFFWEITNVKVT